MTSAICQCIPCYVQRNCYEETEAEQKTLILPLLTLEHTFSYLEPDDLRKAASTCKRWRYVAATLYLKIQDNSLYGIPCFLPFYDNLQTSRHIFIFDVSSSMNRNKKKEHAKAIYLQLLKFIAPMVEKQGLYICKFASECRMRYFEDSETATAFIDEESTLRDGSNLSVAVEEVVTKIIEKSSKNSHVHIISDMDVTFDESILSRKELHMQPYKITFHYYNAARQSKSTFLANTKRCFESLKESMQEVEPEKKKRFMDSVELRFYRPKVV